MQKPENEAIRSQNQPSMLKQEMTKISNSQRGRGGLVVNTSDGSRGRGFEPHSGRRVVSLSKTYLPPPPPQKKKKKVLVIPRKRWLRPDMTEKLLTGTLSIKPNQKQIVKIQEVYMVNRVSSSDRTKLYAVFFMSP